MKYLCLMNMNKLIDLKLNLTNNNIGSIELSKWLEWSGNKLVDLSLDLKWNEIESGYNKNMKWNDINCEVYVNIWDGEIGDGEVDE